MMQRKGDWIQTYTGRMFWPLDPRVEDIHIMDVAHHLSATNRFTGASLAPLSVAQHSVVVSRQFQNWTLAAWGLLHDASEAYTGDLNSQIKRFPAFGFFRDMENEIMRCVARRFGLPWPQPAEVKRMDAVVLKTEKRDLMGQEPMPWDLTMADPLREIIHPWSAVQSKSEFLRRFFELFPKGR